MTGNGRRFRFRRTARSTLGALAALLVLAAAGEASAYVTTSPVTRWSRSRIPVPWYLNNAGSADMAIATTEAAVTAAFDTWTNVDCCYIALAYQGRSSLTAGSSRGSNVVSWSESSWSQGASAIAVCTTWYSSGTIEESDVDCNGVNHTWNTTGSGGVDTQSILTHELGHSLGLGDIYDRAYASSTMYGIYSGGTASRSLDADDMAGCRYLYEEACGGCTTDDQCPSGYRCEGGTCVPVTSDGALCDPCTSHADCNEGYCLSGFPDGGTYCGRNCTSDAACGAGYRCVAVSGTSNQCVPTSLDCAATTPSGCTTDRDCTTGYHCASGSCVPDTPVPDCTSDTDCTGGRVCRDGTCVVPPEPSLRGFGESCTAGDQCRSGLCLDGYCTQTCPPDRPLGTCPDGTYCDDVECGRGQCRRGGPGPGEWGTSCGGDGDCASAFCFDAASGAGICLRPCDPMALGGCDFPDSCQPYATGACGLCSCSAGRLGDPCLSDAECIFGLCLAPSPGDLPRCTASPVGTRCPPGTALQTFETADGVPLQRCTATGTPVGSPCGGDADCQSGLCWGTGDVGLCTRPCGGSCTCPFGTTCQTMSAYERYCLPTSAEEGCGCAVPGRPGAAPALAFLAVLALVLVRRRR